MRRLLLAVPLLSVAANGLAETPAEIEKRVEGILGQMTLEEKIDILGGVNGFYVRGVPRLGVPQLRMADGPAGVRNFGPATAMAGGIALAATWNPTLAERVGIEIGRDARAKGVHFLLGPGVNIYRAPMNGRNFEYFGEDPFLASRIAVGYIKGVQAQGVSATIKHYMGNNSEFGRNSTDSIIDERTLREIYLPVFEAAVKEARVGAVMDSYNLTNGTYLTANGYLNTDVLRKDWGFDGIVMSDWGATHDALGAANGGLDLEMPSPLFMNRRNLMPAIEQGRLTVATIDEKVRRILRVAVRFSWLDREQTDLTVPRYNQDGRQAALQAAREGIVLLKNDANLLPLSKNTVKSIALIGPAAYPALPVGGGSARVVPFAAVSLLEGLSNAFGTKAQVRYARGVPTTDDLARATLFSTADKDGQPGVRVEVFNNADLSGTPTSTRTDRTITVGAGPGGGGVGGGGGFGGGPGGGGPPAFDPANRPSPEPTSTRWTGYYAPETAGSHEVFVEAAGLEYGGYRLLVDDKLVIDNWQVWKAILTQVSLDLSAGPHKVVLEQFRTPRGFGGPRLRVGITRRDALVEPAARALAAKADVVVAAVGYDPELETEGGDRSFRLPIGQDELIQELVAANKKTVVVLSSGGGVDMNAWIDRVPALVEAWYPGQEGGTALAEILLGDANPSGRLPVTFERKLEDNPSLGTYYPEPGTRRIVYKEGLFVGYRGYQQSARAPLFPFGYGMSYTTFKYGGLTIQPIASTQGDPRYEVAFDVTNTGPRAGAEVAEVYVGDKHSKQPRPPKQLAGIAKLTLAAGETRRVSVTLGKRALSYYDADARQWRADAGAFDVFVGRSSEQIVLHDTLTLAAQVASGR
jgi:beta-glucosidase